MSSPFGHITVQLARAIIPVIIVLGVVGNSINITVLTRPFLYNHACSRYFIALSVNGLAYSTINLIYRLLADGYRIDLATFSDMSCKLVLYFTQLCIPMAPYFIVLACWDRYCISSPHGRIRRLSSIRISRWAIWITVVSFALFYINASFVVDLYPIEGFGCWNDGTTVHKQFYAIAQCILYAILAPSLMVFFGLLTICNATRAIDGRVLASRHRRTERQLLLMLLIQVGSHLLLAMPICIIFIMLVLPFGYEPTFLAYFLYSVFNHLLHLCYASAFPLYFLSARIYRKEFLELLKKVPLFRGRISAESTSVTIQIKST